MIAMNGAHSPVRVLIVDDQAPFRRALAAVLAVTEGFELVAAVDGAVVAEAAVAQQHPDLVFIDVRMPDVYGPELARRFRAQYPSLTIVLCSSYARQDVPAEIFGHGVGFLAKEDVSPDSIVELWHELRPDAV
jgi:DNA-binding NarL/FixJ family response regulator